MGRYTAIVPVAGSGTRLRPHTYTYPKVLLTVGDKPILGHIVDRLISAGIDDICFVIGYLGEKVKDYISKNYAKRIKARFVIQDEQKGLGHAIWLTAEYVSGAVLIILGDTIIDADIKEFLNPNIAVIGVKEVDEPRRFGVVRLKGDIVIDMVEKPENPPTNLAIAGIYSFPDSSRLYLSLDKLIKADKKTRGEYQLTDALRMMVKDGYKIKAVRIDGWYDCGKPQTLLETNRYILSLKRFSPKIPQSVVIPPVYVSKSAKVVSSIIGPYVSVGDDVVIENSIISSTIINEGAVIKNSNLTKSIIGPNASVIGKSYSFNVGENSQIRLDEIED